MNSKGVARNQGNKVAAALAAAVPAPLRYAGPAPALRLRCSFVMRRRAGRFSALRARFSSAARYMVAAIAAALFMKRERRRGERENKK